MAACGDKGGQAQGENTQGESTGTPVTSSATDQWPAGVFDAYGVPAYTAGEIIYATPDDPSGNVLIKTTREEFTAWIASLRAAGFRCSDYQDDEYFNRSWESFKFYLPQPGSGHYLSGYFSFENDGAGTTSYYYDEESGVEVEYQYNLSLSIGEDNDDKTVQSDMLTAIGLPNEAIIPDAAISADCKTITEDPLYVMGAFGYYFDVEMTDELYRAALDKIIYACCAASDDGVICSAFNTSVTYDAAAAKAEGLSSWIYNYQGTPYFFMFLTEDGFDSGIAFSVQQTK